MTEEEKDTVINGNAVMSDNAFVGGITFRIAPKKAKPAVIPKPKAELQPKQPEIVPVKETALVQETLITTEPAQITETIPAQQKPDELPEITVQQEISQKTDAEYVSENISRTETTPEKKENPVSHPEFIIQNLDFKTRIIPEDELPEFISDIADISKVYAALKNSNLNALASYYMNAYVFRDFLQEMYSVARRNGNIRYYAYDGKEFLDFPIDNDLGKKRIFASFIPDKNDKEKWFCFGFRQGGKIHDLARFSKKIDGDYSHLQQICDLEGAGINSQFELRRHVEDSFIKAAEEQSIYQYSIGNQTIIEYPIYLKKENKNQILTISFSSTGNGDKWQFITYHSRKTAYALSEAIRIDESRAWRHAEKGKRKEEEKLQKAKREEAEYKAREAEKTLIPFSSFPVKKIQPKDTTDYFGNFSRFAYHPQTPYLYVPNAGIDIRDADDVLTCIKETFKFCNPYTDINYYTTPEGNIAELKVIFPQCSDREIYAVFTENSNKQRQPWYLKRLDYNSKFHRVIETENIEKLYDEFSSIVSIEKSGITTAEELDAYLNHRFIEAISSDEIYVYGDASSKRAELPLHLNTEDDKRIHAYIISTENLYRWKITGFKLRTGDDVRFCISNEYKAECAEKQAAIERREIEKYTKEESRESVSSEKESAKKDCTVKEQGTQVLGTDGKPISLIDFCKEINNRPLHLLSLMAEEEVWGFSETEPFEILYKYLNAQFIRLGYEKKLFVRYTREGTPKYAVMHTGLFSRELHEPIYAGFKAIPQFSQNYTGPLWRLDGFCCKSEGGSIYDNITEHFTEFPENVDFMRENGEYIPLNHYVLDLKEPITLKEEHILKERGYRLPTDFLRRVFDLAKDQKAEEYLQTLESLTTEEEQKDLWINTFSDYLENTPSTYDKLLQRLQVVVEEAQTSNIRKPLPTYYPRDNKITWLLPLRFHEESDLKNLALVVGLRDSGGYKGITLMNIEYVYHRVRVIENPDRSWLKTEILDNYVIDPSVLLSIGEEEADYVSETYGVYDE